LYFEFEVVELLIDPVVDLWPSNEGQGHGHLCIWLLHNVGEWVHDFVDLVTRARAG
jgi:hypothetical protein